MSRRVLATAVLVASLCACATDVKTDPPSPWRAAVPDYASLIQFRDTVTWNDTARWNDTLTWNTVAQEHHQIVVSRRSTPHRSTGARHSATGVEACILARENGGDYGRSSNPSHFGAYQFDRQTWAANGGNPDTWGSASPAEQDAVFHSTVARYGYSPWRPYDGC